MSKEDDPFDLQRFVEAQAPVLAAVRSELRAGRKRTHWMWFVFPQLAGLGASVMSRRYAVGSLAEAGAYLAHPALGRNLRECVGLVLASGQPVADIFGYPDADKFRSCVTLFALASPDEPLFAEALKGLCGGEPDLRTIALLRKE
jgi:uncharacterized protein (DUF1810 family)